MKISEDENKLSLKLSDSDVFIHLKTFITSIIMTLAGLFILSLSIYFYMNKKNHEGFTPSLVISLIILIPGIYSFVISFNTFEICKKKKSFNNSLSYDIL